VHPCTALSPDISKGTHRWGCRGLFRRSVAGNLVKRGSLLHGLCGMAARGLVGCSILSASMQPAILHPFKFITPTKSHYDEGMAYIFGIVAGTLNVAALFNNCVDCFEYVQLASEN
jgi:hypothetical protein